MHAKSWVLASASALAMAGAVIAGQAERPRIFFPREIKREYSNTTSKSAPSRSKATTTRDLLSDLVGEILGPTSQKPSSTAANSNSPVTPYNGATSGLGTPEHTILPSQKGAQPEPQPKTNTSSNNNKKLPSDPGAILIAPTGIVPGSNETSSRKDNPPATTDGSKAPADGDGSKTKPKVDSKDKPKDEPAVDSKGDDGSKEKSKDEQKGDEHKGKPALINNLPIVGNMTGSPSLPKPNPTPDSNGGKMKPDGPSSPPAGTSPPPLPKIIKGSNSTAPPETTKPHQTPAPGPPEHPIPDPGPASPTQLPTKPLPIVALKGNETSTTPPVTKPVTEPDHPKPVTEPEHSKPPTTDVDHPKPVPDVPKTNGTSFAPDTSPPVTLAPNPFTHNNSSDPTTTGPIKSPPNTGPPPPPPPPPPHGHEPGVTSLTPTATLPMADWLPPTMVVERPSTGSKDVPSGNAPQTLPPTIPKIIYPDDPNKPVPEGTVPIQIGFTSPLNYIFVSSNTVAALQIFKCLPMALNHASGISIDKLQISKLVPYNTQSTWGYVTTLAQLNYPASLVDTLQMDLWSPNSALYHHPDPLVRNLTALINPNIDIHGNIHDSGMNGGDDGNSGGSGGANHDAFAAGSGGTQSSKQKATTACIAIAALGFSAMYGAAMFIVARRYKRKRQSHRRASSVGSSQGSSNMRYNANGGPALMGGALMSQDGSTIYGTAGARDSRGSGGHSARTANISAPVATENSLGWN